MGKLGEISLIVFVSAVVGTIVALPVILLTEEAIFVPMIKAALAGITIGLIARYTTNYIFYNINNHPVYTFASIFIIILIGTTGAAILFDTQNVLFITWMVIFAEIIGMSVSVILYRYISRLNYCLGKTQEKFLVSGMSEKKKYGKQ